MTKQQLLMVAIAIVLLAGGAWFFKAPHAEAPVSAQNPVPVITTTQNATTTMTQTASTTPPSTPVVKITPKPAVAPAKTPTYAVVTYDGQNFSPHKITISKGGSVRFLNLSSEDMWVASGIHPLHSQYPIHTSKDCAGSIFDECAAVGKGGHWDFTFGVEGSWEYHNHKKPISEGIVRVLLPGEKPTSF